MGILKLSAEVRSLPEEGRPAYRQVGLHTLPTGRQAAGRPAYRRQVSLKEKF